LTDKNLNYIPLTASFDSAIKTSKFIAFGLLAMNSSSKRRRKERETFEIQSLSGRSWPGHWRLARQTALEWEMRDNLGKNYHHKRG
jgi:hypothetical protein